MAHWSHKEHSKDAWTYLINQTNCEVLDNENIRKYSDHNSVIIELDL